MAARNLRIASRRTSPAKEKSSTHHVSPFHTSSTAIDTEFDKELTINADAPSTVYTLLVEKADGVGAGHARQVDVE